MTHYIVLDFNYKDGRNSLFGYVQLCKNKVRKLLETAEKCVAIDEDMDFCDFDSLRLDCLGEEEGSIVVGEVALEDVPQKQIALYIKTIKYGYSIYNSNEAYIEDMINTIYNSQKPALIKTQIRFSGVGHIWWSLITPEGDEKCSATISQSVLKTLLESLEEI